MAHYGNQHDPFTIQHGVTKRQWEVLAAIASNGHQNTAAMELGITYQTLKNHVHDALKNLDVPNVMAAFRKLGWLAVPNHPGDTGGWPEVRKAIHEELLPALASVTIHATFERHTPQVADGPFIASCSCGWFAPAASIGRTSDGGPEWVRHVEEAS